MKIDDYHCSCGATFKADGSVIPAIPPISQTSPEAPSGSQAAADSSQANPEDSRPNRPLFDGLVIDAHPSQDAADDILQDNDDDILQDDEDWVDESGWYEFVKVAINRPEIATTRYDQTQADTTSTDMARINENAGQVDILHANRPLLLEWARRQTPEPPDDARLLLQQPQTIFTFDHIPALIKNWRFLGLFGNAKTRPHMPHYMKRRDGYEAAIQDLHTSVFAPGNGASRSMVEMFLHVLRRQTSKLYRNALVVVMPEPIMDVWTATDITRTWDLTIANGEPVVPEEVKRRIRQASMDSFKRQLSLPSDHPALLRLVDNRLSLADVDLVVGCNKVYLFNCSSIIVRHSSIRKPFASRQVCDRSNFGMALRIGETQPL